MNITEEFKEKSIFPEYVFESIIDNPEFLNEIGFMIFNDVISRLNDTIHSIQYLQQKQYGLSRSVLDRFDGFKTELVEIRRTYRSLLAGIRLCTAIRDKSAITEYEKKWQLYDNDERSMHTFYFHHQFIYQQFKKVESLEELAQFNAFFHGYLVELAFKLAQIFILRATYTIEYFKDEDAFKAICSEAKLNLNNFIEGIENLKRKPSDFDSRAT